MNYEAARKAWIRRLKQFDITTNRYFVYDIQDLPPRLIAKELSRICEHIIDQKGFYIVGDYPISPIK
jgi:hypothetical protein